jgi:hypothetical protein
MGHMLSREDAPVAGSRPLLFVFATICTLPSAVELGLYAAFLISRKEWMVDCVVLGCLFGWPVLGLLAVGGLVLIVFSWIRSPNIHRVLLTSYTLLIVGFAAMTYHVATGRL